MIAIGVMNLWTKRGLTGYGTTRVGVSRITHVEHGGKTGTLAAAVKKTLNFRQNQRPAGREYLSVFVISRCVPVYPVLLSRSGKTPSQGTDLFLRSFSNKDTPDTPPKNNL